MDLILNFEFTVNLKTYAYSFIYTYKNHTLHPVQQKMLI